MEEPHKPSGLSGVQRERAEAGVLLLNVRLAQKAKHGIAVKRERTRQFPLAPNFMTSSEVFFIMRKIEPAITSSLGVRPSRET